MSTILQLAPQNVWKHFYSLTRIPRPSGHTEEVAKFLVNFGKELGFESFTDEVGNVIIRKPATPGMKTARASSCKHTWTWCPRRTTTPCTTSRKTP